MEKYFGDKLSSRTIADGELAMAFSIKVWEDPWLPNSASPYVSTPMHDDQLAGTKVHYSLLDMQHCDWG